MKVRVIDGDTFDADIDRNGLFSNPEERIRLLCVDTPELSESHKGKDPRHGHSYFDTRYSWPEGFRTYPLSEAHAFENTFESGSTKKHAGVICFDC